MARFTVIHCRQLQLGLTHFDVRVLEGVFQEGDLFHCRGAYESKLFRVQSVLESSTQTTLICAGSVDFENELTHMTLDTDVIPPPPKDLPIPSHIPIPTPDEDRALGHVIEHWDTRAPVQRAVCLCLLRGDDTYEKIGRSLGLSTDQVKKTLQGVWGVLAYGGKIWFK